MSGQRTTTIILHAGTRPARADVTYPTMQWHHCYVPLRDIRGQYRSCRRLYDLCPTMARQATLGWLLTIVGAPVEAVPA